MAISAGPEDRSSSITSGGTAQTLMSENSARRWFWVQNTSSGDLYIDENGTASATSGGIKIQAGALYEWPTNAPCPRTTISIFGATTGQTFSAREY